MDRFGSSENFRIEIIGLSRSREIIRLIRFPSNNISSRGRGRGKAGTWEVSRFKAGRQGEARHYREIVAVILEERRETLTRNWHGLMNYEFARRAGWWSDFNDPPFPPSVARIINPRASYCGVTTGNDENNWPPNNNWPKKISNASKQFPNFSILNEIRVANFENREGKKKTQRDKATTYSRKRGNLHRTFFPIFPFPFTRSSDRLRARRPIPREKCRIHSARIHTHIYIYTCWRLEAQSRVKNVYLGGAAQTRSSLATSAR